MKKTNIFLITGIIFLIFIIFPKAEIRAADTDVLLCVHERFQEHNEWCWAAASQAVLEYYGSIVSQCVIANWAWGMSDCCEDTNFDWSHPCNRPNAMYGQSGSIKAILAHLGVSSIAYGYLSKKAAVSEINAGRPFVIGFKWIPEGGHVLVGFGYDQNGTFLDYMDPWPDNGYTKSLYSWVVSAPDHNWINTLKISTNPTDPPHVNLIAPNGGEVIPSGSIYTILWSTCSDPDALSFKLMYSLDNGLIWDLINPTPLTGTSYDWTVPKPLGNKKNCLVKAVAYNSSNVKIGADKSDAPFTIEVVKLTLPDGGENLESGSIHTIKWQTNGTKNPVAKVKLLYTNDGGVIWNLIDTLTGNPGSFDWEVPCVKETKNNWKVKVILIDKSGNILGQDSSNGYFTVVPSCDNIAGTWPFSDSGTITCTYNGYTEKAPISGDGSVSINQNGCNISWTVSGISGINETRKGTICGNSLTVSGKFCVPLKAGVTLTENQFTATGIIGGGEINGSGSGVCSGSYQGINFSCRGKDTFVITLDEFGTIDKTRTVREPSPILMNNSLTIFPAVSP